VDIFSLIGSGKDAEAMEAIDELIADFNDHSDLPEATFLIGEEYYNKAVEFEKKGLGEQASENFTKALAIWERITMELPPEALFTQHAWYFTGVCYRRHLGDNEKALEYYQKVTDKWPEYQYAWSAQYMVAECYKDLIKSGQLQESEAEAKIEQAYKAVIEKYPDCSLVGYACLKVGWRNFDKGRWATAAEYFELLLEKHPNDNQRQNILYKLGQAYENMGKLELATDIYGLFLEMSDPNDCRVENLQKRIEKFKGVEK